MIVPQEIVKQSFLFTYLMLFGLSLITFIEAFKAQSPRLRHIYNLETCVSVIAGLVYSIFYEKLKSNQLDLDTVTQYRYMDWLITTPMLLLVLLMFLNFESRREIHFTVYAVIVALDVVMLVSGYLGETKKLDAKSANVIGFTAFIAMMSVIYYFFLWQAPFVLNNYILFVIFVLVWGSYGIAYHLDANAKNLMYNGLDVISKAMFGVFIWLFYSEVVVFP